MFPQPLDTGFGERVANQNLHGWTLQASQLGDHEINRTRELFDVRRLDGRIRRNTKLVATELAVGLGIEDPVRTQGGRDLRRVYRQVEVDRHDYRAALLGTGHEGSCIRGCFRPRIEYVRRA